MLIDKVKNQELSLGENKNITPFGKNQLNYPQKYASKDWADPSNFGITNV